MNAQFEKTFEKLKDEARKSWSGQIGEDRAKDLESFLRKKLKDYSDALGYSEDQILESIESRRNYSAINYYQESKFPDLSCVRLFDTEAELRASITKLEFRCPACSGVSTDPYKCNASDKCNWRTSGLFGTFGKGFRFTIKESFLQKPFVDEIFMPIEFEGEILP